MTQRQERADCVGGNVNYSICTEERRQERLELASKELGPYPEGNGVSWEGFEYRNYMMWSNTCFKITNSIRPKLRCDTKDKDIKQSEEGRSELWSSEKNLLKRNNMGPWWTRRRTKCDESNQKKWRRQVLETTSPASSLYIGEYLKDEKGYLRKPWTSVY